MAELLNGTDSLKEMYPKINAVLLELDDAATTTKLNYLNPVSSYSAISSTYPSPKLGDVVQVTETNDWYRYDGTGWKIIQNLNLTGYETTASVNSKIDSVTAQLAQIQTKQDWFDVINQLKVANDSRILLKKVNENNLNVYINHYKDVYQKWILTRDTDFDNTFPTHANGNCWMINRVENYLLNTTNQLNGSDAAVTKSGSWASYPPSVTLNALDAYVEATVTGNEITLVYIGKDDGGIAEVSIDGSVITTVDMYYASSGSELSTVIATGLADTAYTVKVRVTGTKNALSSNTNIRVKRITATTKLNLSTPLTIGEKHTPLTASTRYRYGQSAIEIAVGNTYNGNTVFSGTYHKNCYPITSNGQKIYIDGELTDISSLVLNQYYVLNDLRMVQNLMLTNNGIDIASLYLTHHFSKVGCNIKWFLEFVKAVKITASYNLMFGTSVNKILFGDTQSSFDAIKDGKEKGSVDTNHCIGWHTTDEYVIGVKALNMPKMKSNYRNFFFVDRSTDAKIYMPKYAGDVAIGDKWESNFIITIGKCNDVAKMLSV